MEILRRYVADASVDLESEKTYEDLATAGGRIADCMQAFRTFVGPGEEVASPRGVEPLFTG